MAPELLALLCCSHKLAPYMQDFSESFAFSGPLPSFSPDGRLIAAAAEYRLVIRDADSLQVGALLKAEMPSTCGPSTDWFPCAAGHCPLLLS